MPLRNELPNKRFIKDEMMKTNIKMRVTPEQSKQVQKIVFANGGGWTGSSFQEVSYIDYKFLYINEEKVIESGEDANVFRADDFEEVNADLYISTNGTCEETYKETYKDTEGYDLTEFGYDRVVVDGILLEGNPQPNLEEYDNFTKADTNKSNLAILFDTPNALNEIADILDFGAKKYDRKNWAKVDDKERYIAAALRHISLYHNGEQIDPESNKHHLAHAICSLLFLTELDFKEIL